jgi:hypothetical protein
MQATSPVEAAAAAALSSERRRIIGCSIVPSRVGGRSSMASCLAKS